MSQKQKGMRIVAASRKTGIVAECMCDLPQEIIKSCGVDIIYFLIETESGVFTDTDEVTAENIISYMETVGGIARSLPPSAEIYKNMFVKNLERYDEVVFISVSSQISRSLETAVLGAKMMGEQGEKVHFVDSGHLSSGLGFVVMRAAELADSGCTAQEIVSELENFKGRVSTSFMAKNADYLYRNGLVSKAVKNACELFNAHPVLMMKNGKLTLKTIFFGNYDSACRKYIRYEVKGKDNIDLKSAFITHVGCSIKMLRIITAEAEKYCRFEKLDITTASATISGNCGPGTFGILYVKK